MRTGIQTGLGGGLSPSEAAVALEALHLESDASTTDGKVFTTGSISHTAGALSLICITSRTGAKVAAVVTSSGRTWTLVTSTGFRSNLADMRIYQSYEASATSGAITITFDAGDTDVVSLAWTVVEVPESASAATQSAVASPVGAVGFGPVVATLVSPPGATSVSLGFASDAFINNTNMTQDPDYVILGTDGVGTQNVCVQSAWDTANQEYGPSIDDISCVAIVEVAAA